MLETAAKRDGSRYGRGGIKTAFTTLNIAVVAPIPNASTRTATAVNPRGLHCDLTKRMTDVDQQLIQASLLIWLGLASGQNDSLSTG